MNVIGDEDMGAGLGFMSVRYMKSTPKPDNAPGHDADPVLHHSISL